MIPVFLVCHPVYPVHPCLIPFLTFNTIADNLGNGLFTYKSGPWRHETAMAWNDIIVDSLKKWDTSLVAYVPDISIDRVTTLIDDDPYFHLVSATREEEAVGVAVGAYATGRNSAVFMQSSGFGNSINAIASLCIPARTPIPIFLNLRGGPGEFNIAQVPMGRATRPILDVFGLVHFTLEDEYNMEKIVDGALKLCHANRQPVAICMTQLLHGGKLA